MKAFRRWKQFAKKVASIQASILLSVIYFVIILPMGILMRLFGFTLSTHGMKKAQKKSFWVKRAKTVYDMRFARKQ